MELLFSTGEGGRTELLRELGLAEGCDVDDLVFADADGGASDR